MGDRLSAERACKDPNPIIDGRKANVNLAILGAKPRGNLAQGKLINFIILPGVRGRSRASHFYDYCASHAKKNKEKEDMNNIKLFCSVMPIELNHSV
jgi:hypothetical protein